MSFIHSGEFIKLFIDAIYVDMITSEESLLTSVTVDTVNTRRYSPVCKTRSPRVHRQGDAHSEPRLHSLTHDDSLHR